MAMCTGVRVSVLMIPCVHRWDCAVVLLHAFVGVSVTSTGHDVFLMYASEFFGERVSVYLALSPQVSPRSLSSLAASVTLLLVHPLTRLLLSVFRLHCHPLFSTVCFHGARMHAR
jgi:hypothetical protein